MLAQFVTVEIEARQQEACLWDKETRKLIAHFKDAEHILAFSPDSRKVIIRDTGGRLRLREAATGKPIRLPIPDSDIHEAAFTPDGRIAVTSTSGRVLRFWDGSTGKPIGPRLVSAYPPYSYGVHRNWLSAFNKTNRRIVIPHQISQLHSCPQPFATGGWFPWKETPGGSCFGLRC